MGAHLLRPYPVPQTNDRNSGSQRFLLEIRKSSMALRDPDAIQNFGTAAMQRIHPEN